MRKPHVLIPNNKNRMSDNEIMMIGQIIINSREWSGVCCVCVSV